MLLRRNANKVCRKICPSQDEILIYTLIVHQHKEESVANPIQLRLIHQGNGVWNKWRVENPSQDIDLNETNPTDDDPREANLKMVLRSGANLRRAYLTRTDLSGVDLRKAELPSRLQNLARGKLTFRLKVFADVRA